MARNLEPLWEKPAAEFHLLYWTKLCYKGRAMKRYLIVPGWSNSGPTHWQSHWQRALGAERVEMPNWEAPRRVPWIDALDAAIRAAPEPPVLIAHSLGCVAVVHWAAQRLGSVSRLPAIRGALLVAPADVDCEGCPGALADFAPVPRVRLPFATHVVASDDDPYAALEIARRWAEDWGESLAVLSNAGHINVASGFGPWREGYAQLGRVAGDIAASSAA